LPRFQLAILYGSEDRFEEAVKTISPLLDARNELSPYERLIVDWYDAALRGRNAEKLAAAVEAEKLAPTNYLVNYIVGQGLIHLNRPRAALATFAKVPYPEWAARTGSAAWRFALAARARHMLADYEGELRETRDALRVEPQSLGYRGALSRALVALGRVDEALRQIDDTLLLPGSAGTNMLSVALELRAHGHREASLNLANRAVTWYRGRSPEMAKTESVRAGLATALYVAEKWDEARTAFAVLVTDFPEAIDYRGFVGALAARRGDRQEALKRTVELRRLDRPYVYGLHTYWQARIAALLGVKDQAVDLMREAFAQGLTFTVDIHCDMDLEALADNPPFRELMRPKD